MRHGGFKPTGRSKPSAEYLNRSGQVIDVGRLLCLFDAAGPCANAVKDAQRSKTDETSRATLTVIWGTSILAGRSDAVRSFYVQLLADLDAKVEPIWPV